MFVASRYPGRRVDDARHSTLLAGFAIALGLPQTFGTGDRRSVDLVEERRGKLALLTVKRDDASPTHSGRRLALSAAHPVLRLVLEQLLERHRRLTHVVQAVLRLETVEGRMVEPTPPAVVTITMSDGSKLEFCSPLRADFDGGFFSLHHACGRPTRLDGQEISKVEVQEW